MSFPEAKARDIVRERSGGRCEAAVEHVCIGQAQSIHHRKKRSHGGTWAPSNLLHVCGDGTMGCHGWIEAHPKKANYEGLWLFEGEDPLTTSVHMRWMFERSWWYLDDEGLLHWDESDYEPITLSLAAPQALTNYRRAADVSRETGTGRGI